MTAEKHGQGPVGRKSAVARLRMAYGEALLGGKVPASLEQEKIGTGGSLRRMCAIAVSSRSNKSSSKPAKRPTP